MENKTNLDVIVIGAGPSGIACAVTVARAGYKVLVIEKSSKFGTKNMFGGAVYLKSIEELFPSFYKNVPYERFLTKHNYVVLNGENNVCVSYSNFENKTSATITRYAFDTFLAEEARKEGVYFAPDTLVVDLIKKDGKITGVKTELEEVYAPITVLAEGFNSLLSIKSGLKEEIKPKSAILAVKEVFKLKKEIIEQRFNLSENEGAIYEFFGGIKKNKEETPLAMGFLYTFKNTISIGLGISMESLQKNKIPPYEYLERLKKNKFVSSLIEGGELLEYSAHSIPEGGFKEIPKLYDNGVLMVGDCANLVDSIHFEGTNLAIKSGILAGETCNLALKKKNYTKNTLKIYKNKLYKSFVIQDLKTYRNVIPTLFNRRNSVFSYYPQKIDEFFKLWTSADNSGKKRGYRKFLFSFLKDRSLFEILKDVISFVKCLINAII